MTDRYTLFEIENLRDRFALPSGVPAGVKMNYNISPTQTAPAIVVANGVREMRRMKWGFLPRLAKDSNSVFRYKTYNARSEDVFSKPNWQHAIRYSRCLVPANGFYAWESTDTGKNAYYIHSKKASLVAFAAVYSTWEDSDGTEWGTYSIVTTVANKEIANISPRMPVMLLSAEDEATWLDPSIDDMNTLYDLMRPYTHDSLIIEKVSPKATSLKASGAQLIAPIQD